MEDFQHFRQKERTPRAQRPQVEQVELPLTGRPRYLRRTDEKLLGNEVVHDRFVAVAELLGRGGVTPTTPSASSARPFSTSAVTVRTSGRSGRGNHSRMSIRFGKSSCTS